jgi:hypothetical protein
MVKKVCVSLLQAARGQPASLLILNAQCRKQKRALVEGYFYFKEPTGTVAVGNHAAQVTVHSMRKLPRAVLGASDRTTVAKTLNIHDRVSWNSEAGRVSGTITRVHTCEFKVKGYTHHASRDDPQYEIKSSKTDHIAFHKGSALTRLGD